jgi:hypothetical protein
LEANLFEVIFDSVVSILFPLALALVLAFVALTALLLLLKKIR